MRIAFVDMLFSWPPHGGADTDLFHTICGIQRLGHEVRLFAAKDMESRERAGVDPAAMAFPVTRLDFRPAQIDRRNMPARFRESVRTWKPDAVYLGFGYFLKPYVAGALAEWPMVARFYAYELACPRDLRLFTKGAPCPGNYLTHPEPCRRCTLTALAGEIKNGRLLAWSREYLAARAFMPGYHRRLLDFVRQCRTLIVYNEIQRGHLLPFHNDVRVIPGGVEVSRFADLTPPKKARGHTKTIFMSGRAEDPAKGLDVLVNAGEILARTRSDFEIRVTVNLPPGARPWLKSIAWQDPNEMSRLYAEADICVVPSVWEEPFGLVAIEGMAAGRPVCAARSGGLPCIIEHGRTGLLFDRGDAAALARHLETLLDDEELRSRLGEAGRKEAQQYDWNRVIARHYPQLLEDLLK